MMENDTEGVLILTVRLDEESQRFFNELRTTYFPPERNYLNAHLTLFHKLPEVQETLDKVQETVDKVQDVLGRSFEIEVSGLMHLGAGVAYRLESAALSMVRSQLAAQFKEVLSLQDQHGFRGHITVQNKVTPEQSKALLIKLSEDFKVFKVEAIGLDLWQYLGGPWAHKQYFPFAG